MVVAFPTIEWRGQPWHQPWLIAMMQSLCGWKRCFMNCDLFFKSVWNWILSNIILLWLILVMNGNHSCECWPLWGTPTRWNFPPTFLCWFGHVQSHWNRETCWLHCWAFARPSKTSFQPSWITGATEAGELMELVKHELVLDGLLNEAFGWLVDGEMRVNWWLKVLDVHGCSWVGGYIIDG